MSATIRTVSRLRVVSWLLRVGVAVTFLYAAYSGFVSPSLWVGYIPDLPVDVDRAVLLQVWGLTEAVLALWLLSGWRIYLPACAFVLLVGGLMLTNPGQFSILFRDLTIIFASIALVVLHYPGFAETSK